MTGAVTKRDGLSCCYITTKKARNPKETLSRGSYITLTIKVPRARRSWGWSRERREFLARGRGRLTESHRGLKSRSPDAFRLQSRYGDSVRGKKHSTCRGSCVAPYSTQTVHNFTLLPSRVPVRNPHRSKR